MVDRNVQADQLIQHFYRWLRSPSSQLYDPALHQCVRVRVRVPCMPRLMTMMTMMTMMTA